MAGSIKKMDGRGRKWYVRVDLGRDATGMRRQHCHMINGTKKDAQTYLNGVLRDRDLGQWVPPTKTTVGEWLDQWLRAYKAVDVTARTLASYEKVLKLYVRPALGEGLLSTLKTMDIQQLYADLAAKKRSPATIRYAHALLSSALEQAVDLGMIPRNPASKTRRPPLRRKERPAFDILQARKFIQACTSHPRGVLLIWFVVSGLRPGELQALQWPDLDWDTGEVRVARSVEWDLGGGSWRLKEPKTPSGQRTIVMPRACFDLLKKHKARQAEDRLAVGPAYQDHQLVFAREDGQPFRTKNLIERHLRPLLKGAELDPRMRLYDLRHSMATVALEMRESPKIVAERMGHSSSQITLDVYSHTTAGMGAELARRMQAALFD